MKFFSEIKSLFLRATNTSINRSAFFSEFRSQEEVVKFFMGEIYLTLVQLHQQENALTDFASTWLKELVELSLLFDYMELHKRYATFLQKATIGNTMAGAITNIPAATSEQIARISKEMKKVKSKQEIIAAYPQRDNHYYLMYWSKRDYAQKTLAGHFQEAIQTALIEGDEWNIECIASTLVLMNKFEEAQYVADNYLTTDYRIESVDMVKAIEYNRSGQWNIAYTLIKEQFAKGMSVWDLLIYIKGINQLEPWGGYPYTDY
jgi:hypothetical protein